MAAEQKHEAEWQALDAVASTALGAFIQYPAHTLAGLRVKASFLRETAPDWDLRRSIADGMLETFCRDLLAMDGPL